MEDVSEILNGLNEPQRDAVTAPPQHTLVIAGAGSGKTRVLVHRIAWLLQVEQMAPYSVLAVTFTNKAAGEMRGRIEQMLGTPGGALWVGTFHGIAHKLLRLHWREANLPQTFQILDSEDQHRLLKRVVKSLDLDDKQWVPRQIQWFINAKKDDGLRPKDIPTQNDFTQTQLVRVYAAYEEACRRAGVIDFAELLLRAFELLRDRKDVLGHYQRRFSSILVDEFQDTNKIQYAWLQLLAGNSAKLFVVGDDDQSIYGWRGAQVENIQHFQQKMPDVKTVRLEQNYRSTNTILKAANALIANNQGRLGKELWTDGNEGESIEMYAAFDEGEEATWVVGRIQQWVDQGGLRAETALLYRSNAQSRVLEEALIRAKMPYRVYGGQRFFERMEIKDALAYLRLSQNRNDDTSFDRVVNLPTRGIGNTTLEVLRQHAREHDQSLWQAAQTLSAEGLAARAAGAVKGFLALIDSMAEAIEGLPLYEQVEHVVKSSGLIEHYEKEKGEKGLARIENLEELISAARGFERDEDPDVAELSELDQFLANAALEAGEGQADAWEDCVQLMTLHTAKGLEFPMVFLVGMEDGLFPHNRSVEDPDKLEEERRLAYVGVTRAMQKLHISYAESRRLHGMRNFSVPSRFLKEIPAELVSEVRPRVNTVEPMFNRNQNTGFNGSVINDPDNQGLTLGQRVRHKKFGEGTVLNFSGAGQHRQVEINFNDAGIKWLVLSFAKLDPV